MRIALGIEYDGINYHGWQRQTSVSTIQEKIEEAIGEIATHVVTVVCAGRTDAGVHALGQVIHFDTDTARPDSAWTLGVNSHLPDDIKVIWMKHVPSDFHARYFAIARQYKYTIFNNKFPSALLRHRTMWVHKPLNEKLMHVAGQYLIGEHDFSSFRGSDCQSRSTTRNIMALRVTRNSAMVNVEIKANAFLLHMVRNIVGVLIKVGSGEKDPEWIQSVLQACDRKVSAPTAEPQGLYLVGVEYRT